MINFCGLSNFARPQAPDSGVFLPLIYKSAAINRGEKNGLSGSCLRGGLRKSFLTAKGGICVFFSAICIYLLRPAETDAFFGFRGCLPHLRSFEPGFCCKINRPEFNTDPRFPCRFFNNDAASKS